MNCQISTQNSSVQKTNHPIQIKADPDTLAGYRRYDNKLLMFQKQLDSLDNLHEEINVKLKDLKSRSELIRKDQQRADFINGSIIVILIIFLIKLIYSKLKSKKK